MFQERLVETVGTKGDCGDNRQLAHLDVLLEL